MPKRRREEYLYEPGVAVPSDVTRVLVPDSIKVLPEGAFKDRIHLEEVVLPEGLLEIGKEAFIRCMSLGGLRLPSTLLKIGEGTFGCCTSLREINLPEGLNWMGDCVFQCCHSIELIRLSSTLAAIGAWAFSDCSSLKEVILPDGIRSIGRSAFSNCDSLEVIVLPSTLNVIGRYAFISCSSLRIVKLYGDIQIIGESAFADCNMLNHVRIPFKALVITKCGYADDDEQYWVGFARDGTISTVGIDKRHNWVVVILNCFNFMHLHEMLRLKRPIMGILGEDMRQGWDQKRQQLRALLAPHEKRHKKEITSLLELRLWKTKIENLEDNLNPIARAKCRFGSQAEVIIKQVAPFL